MAEIVDLDALVGGDLTFKYAGKELKIPGDISTKTVFEIFQAFKEMHELSAEGDPEKVLQATEAVHAMLLNLFQVLQPDMTELPFGVKTLPIVIQSILRLLGVNVEDDGDSPPARSRAQTRKKKATTKPSRKTASRSQRSSGSPSS